MTFATKNPLSLPSMSNGASNGVPVMKQQNSHGIKGPMGLTERRLKVIQIGAGVTGIEMAHQMQEMTDMDFTIYDKNPDIGGTWFENRYPGCACDVPAHSYSYNWAPNPNWSSWIVSSSEIHQYLHDVVKKHELWQYINLNHRVTKAVWDEARAKWILSIVHEVDGIKKDVLDECDVLISGVGVLNNWKWPQVAGIETFEGKLLHTACWDSSYDFKGKRVAVLGNGASAVQVVPELQKEVACVDIYMRSPTWLTPTPWLKDGITADKIYTKEEKERFANDPEYFLNYRKDIEKSVNSGWAMFYKGSKEQRFIRSEILSRYENIIKNPDVRRFLSPEFAVGCRRPTPADRFLASIHEDNVSVITHAVTEMVPGGIVDEGTTREYDAIVCATGFDTSFVPRFPILGVNGKNLQDVYRTALEAYMGIAISGFPNYFCFAGPASPIANGSVFPGTSMQSSYIRKALTKIQMENIRTMEVSQESQDQFNQWVQSQMDQIVWTSGCQSWYQDEAGKVRVPFPGSLLHYMAMTKEPLYEHFMYQYRGSNKFDWLGNGRTKEELEGNVKDWSPYIFAV